MVLPSSYLGNIEYFYQLWKEPHVLIDIHEPFQKQTYRSRCNIIGANGIQTLTVPVQRISGADILMKDVEISNAENWRKDHLKAIESAYARTPYFEYYIDRFKAIIETDHKLLFELNSALTEFLINKLGLSVEVSFSENQTSISEDDFRINFSSKKESGFLTHRYIQTFEERHGFTNNLSMLDLLFNEGTNSISILQESRYSSL